MSTNTISRRNFLGGAAMLGAGAIASSAGVKSAYADEWKDAQAEGASVKQPEWSFMESPEPPAESEIGEVIDCDIVIVGCGVAAGPATMYASELGANVHLVEKGSGYGNKRFGTCCFNSKFQEKAGIKFKRERMMQDGYRMSGGYNARLDFWGMFFDYSGPVMDYVNSRLNKKQINIVPATGENNFEDIEGTRWNVGTTDDQFFPGDEGFCQFESLDPDWPATKYPEWLEAMYDTAKENGVTFHFNTPAKQLITDAEGNVTGLYAWDNLAGKYIQFNASKGVLLATGGMEGDKEMVSRYCPVLLQKTVDWSMIELKNTGDGHKMAMWIGADTDDTIGNGYWTFCTEKDTSKLRPAGFPQGHQLYWAPSLASTGCLQTNIAGYRFQNECLPFTFNAQGALSQPEGKTWSIWDSAWMEKISPYVQANPHGQSMMLFSTASQSMIDKEVELGITIKADTIEELAEKTGMDLEILSATIEHYNELCDKGEDPDFLKPKNYLTSVDVPPYYAACTVTSTTGTIGGLKYNGNMEVVNKKGLPIHGLYACGVCSGVFYGPTYPGNIVGCAMGHGQTFGVLAIRHMMGIEYGADFPA